MKINEWLERAAIYRRNGKPYRLQVTGCVYQSKAMVVRIYLAFGGTGGSFESKYRTWSQRHTITERRGQWLAVLVRTYEAPGSDVDKETGFQIFVFFSVSQTRLEKNTIFN
jgi:hypothetical protein